MEQVSLREFRRNAAAVIHKVRQGQRFVLTCRGTPVMRLEPIRQRIVESDDPFYQWAQLAESDERPLTNDKIDRIVYRN